MPSCVVRGCGHAEKKRDPSRILHGFPKEPEKIKLWLYQTGQYGADLDDMVVKVYLGKVYDTYRMCSLHFTHDCYRYDGYRRILKKDVVPTVFNTNKSIPSISLVPTNIPLVSGPSSSISQQLIPSAPLADSQKPSRSSTVPTYRVEFPVIHPKPFSQPTVQQMTLLPVVPQRVYLQPCEVSQKSNVIITDRSSVTLHKTVTTEAAQVNTGLSGVSQQSSVARPSNLSILEVPVSLSSLCFQQTTPAVSKVTASSSGGQPKHQTHVNLQQNTSASVTFLQKPVSSVLTNSDSPLDNQLRPEATSSSTKAPSSTTSTCSIKSTASSSVISTFGSDKSLSKTVTTPPVSIPFTVVGEKKPCSVTVLPVSEIGSTVTQTPPTTSGPAKKLPAISVPIPPTSQTVISDSQQPASKKRKLEENIVFLKPIAVSSSNPSVLPSRCINQTSANTGKLIFVPSVPPLIQPSCLIPKPLMVDKSVNTDFSTNKKSCCIATDPMHRRRNVHTQTKIYRKHRKIMCTLLLPSEPTDDSDSTVSLASPEDIGFSDCSPSRSSVDDDDPSEDLETINLDLVKVEILLDSEVDVSLPASSDNKQASLIKEEHESTAEQDCDISKLKIEPNLKTEEDQCLISTPSQNIIDFVSQHLKTERISPIPREPLTPVCGNPNSSETSAMQSDEEPSDSSFHINELSDDEDESFLVPSDGEDEDDVKHVFQDLDSPVENPVEEEKYIVFESCLKKLIMMIPCMSKTKCTSPLTQYRKETIGSYLSIEVHCRSGHTSLLWESQPRHGYEPLGNVLLSAAVLCSGSSFVKSQHMFKLLNVKSIDKASYYRHQSMYLFPAIRHHWREEQKAVIRSVQQRPLCLAGDRQLDNPGFSAKYSIYSLMDVVSKKICSLSVEPVTPQVTLEGLEKLGFQKTMGELQTMNAKVKMVVTDRSIAIQEILKDKYPGIAHKFDLWHLSKSIGNEVLMAAKHKDCEILYQWVEAIKNHIWWSSCTCCNNPDFLIQKWKSVIQHVANVHRWDSDSDCKACHHPPLPKEVVDNTNWLVKGSAAHEQLKKIVENSNLLKDLNELSFLCHAGELEIYRSTCLKYRPKTLHFFMDSMVARTQLAALDHNRNVHRVKEVVKNASSRDELGTMTKKMEISKGQKSWIIKALYEPSCQNFQFDIMNDVIALVKEEKTLQ